MSLSKSGYPEGSCDPQGNPTTLAVSVTTNGREAIEEQQTVIGRKHDDKISNIIGQKAENKQDKYKTTGTKGYVGPHNKRGVQTCRPRSHRRNIWNSNSQPDTDQNKTSNPRQLKKNIERQSGRSTLIITARCHHLRDQVLHWQNKNNHLTKGAKKCDPPIWRKPTQSAKLIARGIQR